MGNKVDIFGDGECVVDEGNFPDEIIVKSGRWKKQNQHGKIAGYTLIEPSKWFQDNLKSVQKQIKDFDKQIEEEQKVQDKIREIAERELENEKKSI